MNEIAKEIRSYAGLATRREAIIDEYADAWLAHEGVGHLDGGHSGRYPWGSGEHPFQHSYDFIKRYNELKATIKSEPELAKAMGFKSTDALRLQVRAAKNEEKLATAAKVRELHNQGYSNKEISRKTGIVDTTIGNILKDTYASKALKARETAKILEDEIRGGKRMIDVGFMVGPSILGVSKDTLDEACFLLTRKGYNVYNSRVDQPTNPKSQQKTTFTVLADKDVPHKDAYQKTGDIKLPTDYTSTDGGMSFNKLQYPASIDGKRIYINYADTGDGASKDGVIELRRGVPDLSLGNSQYSQVRILVGKDKYLKGMAMYSDDVPDGYDIVFNTNKKSNKSMSEVLKDVEYDKFQPLNPFGAAIQANGQSKYIGSDGKEHLSPINKLKEEGNWEEMSKNLSAQFLSKQPLKLIKQQLKYSYDDRVAQYKEIMELDNPVVKQKMLEEFSTTCASDARNMKAAAFPRQSTQVILPMPFLKDTEVYAPGYKNGEKIMLIRYPHGGVFELPVLTVNNKNPKARAILSPETRDAVGINPNVASQLSGADFDGDQVVCIPTGNIPFKTSKPLPGLVGFDPKTDWNTDGWSDAAKKKAHLITTSEMRNRQMGIASNLITDMTLQKPKPEELERAIKYSMVVIDAMKHELDWKAAAKAYDIEGLKKKYQLHLDADGNVVKYGGAASLISRKGQDVFIPERQGSGWIDKETGERIYKQSGRTYTNKKGEEVQATTSVNLIDITEDLTTIGLGTDQEKAYGEYGNKMKALSREAARQSANMKLERAKPEAAAFYKDEVKSLKDKLFIAQSNKPRERQAQALASSRKKAMLEANPGMKSDKKQVAKASTYLMNEAREEAGASSKRTRIQITDREWEAIQAGAVGSTLLKDIFSYTDMEEVKKRATPYTTGGLTKGQQARLRNMLNYSVGKGDKFTLQEMADALGVSKSTITKYKDEWGL